MKSLLTFAKTGATILLLILAALAAGAADSEACSCVIDPPPPAGLSQAERTEHFRKAYRAHVRKQFEESYAIFSADVIALAPDRITFRVEDVWKGDLPKELSMKGVPDPAVYPLETFSSCDFIFKARGKYLIVAYGSSVENMMTKPCTSTGLIPQDARPMFTVNETILALDELVPARLKPKD
jgi:hypothetical protein